MSADEASEELARRVLLLTPVGRDAALAQRALSRAGLVSHVCRDLEELREEIARGAGAVLLAGEALADGSSSALTTCLEDQPAWSDLPVVLLVSSAPGADSLEHLPLVRLKHRKKITILTRPVPMVTLLSILRAAVAARERQYVVRDLLEQLAEGVRQRDEFLAMLGHELRNPLAAIRNAVELLQADESASSPADRFEVGVLDRQSRHLMRIVSDLVDVSRVTTGRLRIHREPLDLAEVARLAVDDLRPTFDSERQELVAELPEEPVVVEGDATRLDQVVKNLLVNAIQHAGRGARIVVSVRVREEGAELRVCDDGVGMSPEVLERVFELFSQARAGRGGLGLGMSLCRRLAEMHGGELTASSAGVGKGSEFVLRLPLGRRRAPARRAEAPSESAALRILLVDDHRDSAESLRLLLERMGHEVEVAHDGGTAVERAGALRPDLTFLDIGLPDTSGLDVARRLREELGLAGDVIALSGFGQEEDRRRSLDAGCTEHLTKPVQRTELRKVVDRVARSRRAGGAEASRAS